MDRYDDLLNYASLRYLVSAGKDRSIGLFVRGYQSENQSYSSEFISTLLVKSAHKRIIWDCCWSPDSRYLVTVSRDGMCKIWLMKSDNDVTSEWYILMIFYIIFGANYVHP